MGERADASIPGRPVAGNRRGGHMSRGMAVARRLAQSDQGMAMPEYAVGCVAACGFGYCLWRVLTSDRVYELLDRLVREGWLDMSILVWPCS